jgi:hypothetical protein
LSVLLKLYDLLPPFYVSSPVDRPGTRVEAEKKDRGRTLTFQMDIPEKPDRPDLPDPDLPDPDLPDRPELPEFRTAYGDPLKTPISTLRSPDRLIPSFRPPLIFPTNRGKKLITIQDKDILSLIPTKRKEVSPIITRIKKAGSQKKKDPAIDLAINALNILEEASYQNNKYLSIFEQLRNLIQGVEQTRSKENERLDKIEEKVSKLLEIYEKNTPVLVPVTIQKDKEVEMTSELKDKEAEMISEPGSWAQVVKNKKRTSQTTPSTSQGKEPTASIPKNETGSSKFITLLVDPTVPLPSLNPITVRNELNKAIGKPLIMKLKKSIKGHLVVELVSEKDYKVFIGKEQVWKLTLNKLGCYYSKIWQKLEEWTRLVAYNVPDLEEELGTTLIEEIQTFNQVELVQDRIRWLGKNPYKRTGTITFTIKEDKSKILEKGLRIFGNYCKVVPLLPFSPLTRCSNCQGYGHNPREYQRVPVCGICSKNHYTKDHNCKECRSTSGCIHLPVKCINCKENHTSFSKDCKVYQSLKEAVSSRDTTTSTWITEGSTKPPAEKLW